MQRLLMITLLICLMLAASYTTSFATNRRTISTYHERLVNYGRLDNTVKTDPTSSLGAYVTDGGSPGYVIGRSFKDDQGHLNTGRMVDWGVHPQIHFIYCNQAVCGGLYNPTSCARWIHYNMFDPTSSPSGVFINGSNGIPMQTSPFTESGMYANMGVDENGKMIGVAEAQVPSSGLRWTRLWWDVTPPSNWGTFVNDSIPDQITGTGLSVNRHFPIVEYQEYNGQYITHLLAINGIDPTDPDDKLISYWRKVNSASGLGSSWTMTVIADGPWADTYDMAVSRDAAGKVLIAWCQERDPATVLGSAIWVMTSTDAGANFTTPVDIVPFTAGVASWQGWNECSVIIDSDGYNHIVYNTTYYNGTVAGDVDPSRIFHWTDRVSGPDAGGTTSLVQALDFHGFENMCGQFGHNLLNNGDVILSECNGRLYTIWMQAGDPDLGDSTDCVDENIGPTFLGAYNSDLRLSISLSLDGSLWDARRDLTNSKTPLCDGTDGNPCDHDSWPTMSRLGMDTRPSVIGPTYWGNVPEAFDVRDAIAPGYPDTGFYLDVQFVDDLLPENAMFLGDAYWTNNPIKWFRLPCLDPIIRPVPYFPRELFVHPKDWVKSGTEVTLEIEIANFGNADLNITSISADPLQGTGWLQVNTPAMLIPAGLSGFASFTLNPGGAITTPPGSPYGIEAWLLFENDEPSLGVDSFHINSVIADTVLAVQYEVVTNEPGVQMGVLNNGSFGNYPHTGGYMAFENPVTDLHADCDSQEVYLYDGSPIIMYDAGTYFWNTYYDEDNHDPAVNLLPAPGTREAEKCSSIGYDKYITGVFVTPDSAIGMNKLWMAPESYDSWVLERWQIFSYDGASHTGVRLGEWADIDVPSSDNASDQGAVFSDGLTEVGFYIWGQDDGSSCTNNNDRFYLHALLGHYWQSEYNFDQNVNHQTMDGGLVGPPEALMNTNYEFIPDSVWNNLNRGGSFTGSSTWLDQRSLLSFGGFDIVPGDTLVIWTVHGSLINANTSDINVMYGAAKANYLVHRADADQCSCCGLYTGGLAGNTDCGEDGKINLADITRLIDRVYISKLLLCCEANGELNGDGKINLADITILIDCTYISKPCQIPCK